MHSRRLATPFSFTPVIGNLAVTAGETFGEVESTKSVSDLYAPISGKVSEVTSDLHPQLRIPTPTEPAGCWTSRSTARMRCPGVSF